MEFLKREHPIVERNIAEIAAMANDPPGTGSPLPMMRVKVCAWAQVPNGARSPETNKSVRDRCMGPFLDDSVEYALESSSNRAATAFLASPRPSARKPRHLPQNGWAKPGKKGWIPTRTAL